MDGIFYGHVIENGTVRGWRDLKKIGSESAKIPGFNDLGDFEARCAPQTIETE
jgi:hypothetical protein